LRLTRADELAVIEHHIATKGATRCPPRCCVVCSAYTEAERLAMIMMFKPPASRRHGGERIAELWFAQNLVEPGIHWVDAAIRCREATHVSWRAIVGAYRRFVQVPVHAV
jgi:hypothetical protein